MSDASLLDRRAHDESAFAGSDQEPSSGARLREKDHHFLIFLLLGQSNMEGAPKAEPRDQQPNPRVKVLAYDDCPSIGRKYNHWYLATPPLHSSLSGVGPGDYFAKTLIEHLPADYSVGLVPCAINGVDLDYFRKNVISARRGEFRIPPDDHWSGAYDWVLSRARLAQQAGVIRGILFHQGESDNCQPAWLDKVRGLVDDLRTDLDLGEAPFLAGELYHQGLCAAHNRLVVQLPRKIHNAFVIPANDLAGIDNFHFDLPAQRELGARYAKAMLSALRLTRSA